MRPIDADKIVLDYSGLTAIGPYDFQGIAKYFYDQIQQAPTIDAVEVLRCKNCKYWNRHIGMVDSPNGYCRMHEETMNSYDFCSYGKRIPDPPKEGEQKE